LTEDLDVELQLLALLQRLLVGIGAQGGVGAIVGQLALCQCVRVV
jgi:hypothetical protein